MTEINTKVPDLEKEIGISLYSTTTPGVSGILRHRPDDFIVREISNYPYEENDVIDKNRKYLMVEVTKENWDTNHFLKAYSSALGISHKRITYAGTKDKRAVTVQKMSLYDVPKENVENVHLKDISVRVLGRSQQPIGLGDLEGNEFKIVIRDIALSADETKAAADKTTAEIIKAGGVPNFFGIQRFGSKRPVTHHVGADILEGDLEKAIMRYVSEVYPDEPEDTKDIRRYIAETGDLKGGVSKLPDYLGHEKALLNHLIARSGDFKGAFMILPKNLYTMFIHAYQSWLFNRIICERLKAGLSLNQAVVGDIVCYRAKDKTPDPSRLEKVDEDNIDGINALLKRRRAFITAPLFGTETPLAEGVPGEIERRLIEETGFTAEDFKAPAFPEVASRGLRKEILLEVEPAVTVESDDLFDGKTKMTLEFKLPKGSYATTVLREYMKTNPLNMS
ncbi:tRNA pseudouridine synthase D [Methanimicrococcus sp. At1]|uniref:Probable tRNA pseudouridine synthase D n=1 Tax=Methanimicrococcus hacksteinii TaxID=3028293 RepID=A0ABU3VNM1_9EURY|nr:tRNA pseudouridine(13) synthase TruD [Methanimicrococcus sp. At1]MDV0445006.1 tRNA pseudouridine synthase D [Methanimicrococcus sp. At1]